jgi:hypothetical protein
MICIIIRAIKKIGDVEISDPVDDPMEEEEE